MKNLGRRSSLFLIVIVLVTYYACGAYKVYEILQSITHHFRIISVSAASVLLIFTVLAVFDFKGRPFQKYFLWLTKPVIAFFFSKLIVGTSDIYSCTLILLIVDVAASLVAERLVDWYRPVSSASVNELDHQTAAPVARTNVSFDKRAKGMKDSTESARTHKGKMQGKRSSHGRKNKPKARSGKSEDRRHKHHVEPAQDPRS